MLVMLLKKMYSVASIVPLLFMYSQKERILVKNAADTQTTLQAFMDCAGL